MVTFSFFSLLVGSIHYVMYSLTGLSDRPCIRTFSIQTLPSKECCEGVKWKSFWQVCRLKWKLKLTLTHTCMSNVTLSLFPLKNEKFILFFLLELTTTDKKIQNGKNHGRKTTPALSGFPSSPFAIQRYVLHIFFNPPLLVKRIIKSEVLWYLKKSYLELWNGYSS